MKQGNSRSQPRKRGRKSKAQKALQAERQLSEQKQRQDEEYQAVSLKPKTKKIHHNTLKAMERKRKAEEERLRKIVEDGNQSLEKEEEKPNKAKQKKSKKDNQHVEEATPKSKEMNAKIEAQPQSQPHSQLPLPAQPLQLTIQSEPERKSMLSIKHPQPQHSVHSNILGEDIFDVLKPIDEVNDSFLHFDEDKPSVYHDFLGKSKKSCTIPECDVFNDP